MNMDLWRSTDGTPWPGADRRSIAAKGEAPLAVVWCVPREMAPFAH